MHSDRYITKTVLKQDPILGYIIVRLESFVNDELDGSNESDSAMSSRLA